MKIILKNFRCYENKIIDVCDKGLALLSGPSGTGKTTILLSIIFSLFGNGNKLVMHGKTSCSVTLEFDDMKIVRTKKPNRLTLYYLDNTYEDDAAQEIINNKFGKAFETTGYIPQNSQKSFIMMSSTDKLDFLEAFAFQDINILQIKERSKNSIKEKCDSLTKKTAQLEMASAMIKELKIPDEIVFPLKCTKKNREKAIQNENIKYKNNSTLSKKCVSKIKLLENELKYLQLLHSKIDSKTESLTLVNKKLSSLSLEENTLEYIGDIKLKELENDLCIILSQKEFVILKDRYEQDILRLENMKTEELYNISSKISEIDKELWQEHKEEDTKDTIFEYTQIIKDLEKLSELTSESLSLKFNEIQLEDSIEQSENVKNELDLKKTLLDKLKLQKEVFKCPSCNVNIKFQNDKLHLIKNDTLDILDSSINIEDVERDILKLKKKLSSMETAISIKKNKLDRYKDIEKNIKDIQDKYEEIPDLIDVKQYFDYMKEYINTQHNMSKQLNKLKLQLSNETFSSSIESFSNTVKSQKKALDKLNTKETKLSNINEEDLRSLINIQKNNKTQLEYIKNNIHKLNIEKIEYEKQLESYTQKHLDEFSIIRNIDIVNKEIYEKQEELENLEKHKIELENNLQNIQKFQDYEKNKELYETWKNKIDVFQKEENECRKEYAAATLLKETILEAESISIANIINSINSHSQIYLDAFFIDNPILIKLVPFKETAKGKNKPQINLEIEYKGMEIELNMLSGGEISRIVLAFALALGEMFNTPMILLDECTASLDQELTGCVIEGIKDNFNGKLVLIIAHQTVKGQFDTVVDII